LLRRSSLTT